VDSLSEELFQIENRPLMRPKDFKADGTFPDRKISAVYIGKSTAESSSCPLF
jgi:hypothetical protein